MFRYIVLLFLLSPLYISAQNDAVFDTIRIHVSPQKINRIILYSSQGAKQKYITYADSKNGEFNLLIPKDSQKGMYRALYNQKSMDYIDFLYVGKAFSISFNPEQPDKMPVFNDSPENTLYYDKLQSFGNDQMLLDSLQVVYFQAQDSLKIKALEKEYLINYNLFAKNLQTFKKQTGSIMVKDLVLATIRPQPQSPIKNPAEYLPYIQKHYFDTIDFNNKNLIHSSILIDKAMDYIFYLTVSQEKDTQNKLYKEAVSEVLNRIDNQEVKSNFIKALIQSFAKDENIVLTDFLFSEFYDKLPDTYRNEVYENGIKQELKTAVGRMAQDIVWKENDKTFSLLKMEGYRYYVLIFWSSTCPHCLKEVPKVYEFLKDKKDVKVIAIALETAESKDKWQSETYYYPGFSHVLALGKWENSLVRNYNINATPTYYILDSDKKIINKPYEFEDLEAFFKE